MQLSYFIRVVTDHAMQLITNEVLAQMNYTMVVDTYNDFTKDLVITIPMSWGLQSLV